MSYSEDDLLPVSAIQHLLFCERQCALIHIERLWVENVFTASGRSEHEKVDAGVAETRRDLYIARGLPIRNLELGLAGKADVVEFRKSADTETTGVSLPKKKGKWIPYPIEYKHGRPKSGICDEAQLCAQAMCLEEMLQTDVPLGSLFYQSIRRRKEIVFNKGLRLIVTQAAQRLRELMEKGMTPPPVNDKRCQNCSLQGPCLPRGLMMGKKIDAYIKHHLESDLQ